MAGMPKGDEHYVAVAGCGTGWDLPRLKGELRTKR